MEYRNINNLTASGSAHVSKNQHSDWVRYPDMAEHGRVEFFVNFPFAVALLARLFTGNPDASITTANGFKRDGIKTSIHTIVNDFVRSFPFDTIPDNLRDKIIATLKSSAPGIVPDSAGIDFLFATPETEVIAETTPETEVVETVTPKTEVVETTTPKKSGRKTTAKK
jgi:hypothetical protein